MAKIFACVTFFLTVLSCSDCKYQDWLVKSIDTKAELQKLPNGNLRLTNGIISREFSTQPDFATVDLYSHEQQSSLLRALDPEAVISLDGFFYPVGGLLTSIPRAYLNRTALRDDVSLNPDAFHMVGFKTHCPEVLFPYTPRRGAPKDTSWPPKGIRLDVTFKAPAWAPVYHKDIIVTLHYEIYEGVPIMSKWLTVTPGKMAAGQTILGVHSVEYLSVNWQWAMGGYDWLHVETDRAHGTSVNWEDDPKREDMPGSFEKIVNCTYSPRVPFLSLYGSFTSFQARILVIGSSDPERVGLAKRRMLRLLAPHTQENPIFFHMVHSDDTKVLAIIDQMADVGFEMLIYSFGSGFDFESNETKYLEQIAGIVKYAHSKNIEVGGYDLIALTRRVKDEWMAVGASYPSACFASGWYDFLKERILNFMDKTGVSFIESDGPYGGYACRATNHAHHSGEEDSVYMQDLLQGEFYTELRKHEVYINQPDNYFYQGGSRTGMGYNENQYSLPRWQDLSISRQGMFDDTFHYTPTVGWMFLPIVDYHGGGPDAAFVPLSEHRIEYNWGLAQYMGAGVAACYRGDRLYDDEGSRGDVKKWVDFYKKYRDILTSDIIHVRRADMQSIDSFMHVNPKLNTKALAMVFNPTSEDQAMNLTLPLYYTGLEYKAMIGQEGINFNTYLLDRGYNVEVFVKLRPLQITWFLIL